MLVVQHQFWLDTQCSSMLQIVHNMYAQSYEIKLPPQAILGFKILETFSVENYNRLDVMM